jgi:hypothetical protein
MPLFHAELEDAYEWARDIREVTYGYQNAEICDELDR